MKATAVLVALATLLCTLPLYNAQDDTSSCSDFGSEGDCVTNSAGACSWVTNAVGSGQCRCASSVRLDILFAVDTSGSIGKDDFQLQKAFLDTLVTQGVNNGSKLGFVMFASQVNFSEPIRTWDSDDLSNYVNGLYWTTGYTNTPAMLAESILEFQGIRTMSDGSETPYEADPDRQQIMIMVTDGNPCLPENQGGCPQSVCQYDGTFKSLGVRVVIVGVGSGLNSQHVICLTQTDDDFFPLSAYSTAQFDSIMGSLSAITCPINNNSLVTEEPSSNPTTQPSADPTSEPSMEPTIEPSIDPTIGPSADPTIDPTSNPSTEPSMNHSKPPTSEPTAEPTKQPTIEPTNDHTIDPSFDPTLVPSKAPSLHPSRPPTTAYPSASTHRERRFTTRLNNDLLAVNASLAQTGLTMKEFLREVIYSMIGAARFPQLRALMRITVHRYWSGSINFDYSLETEQASAFELVTQNLNDSVATNITVEGITLAVDGIVSLSVSPSASPSLSPTLHPTKNPTSPIKEPSNSPSTRPQAWKVVFFTYLIYILFLFDF